MERGKFGPLAAALEFVLCWLDRGRQGVISDIAQDILLTLWLIGQTKAPVAGERKGRLALKCANGGGDELGEV